MAFKIQPRKASKKQMVGKFTIQGPPGAGKTYTALGLATAMAAVDMKRILVADTQGGQADVYGGEFDFDVVPIDKDDCDPRNLVKIIEYAHEQNYGVLIIDTLSHAWEWTLKYVNNIQEGTRNQWTAWGKGGEPWDELISAILSSRVHIICCSRSKMAYVQEKDSRGKTVVNKVGMSAKVRDGSEFEFDLVLEMSAPDNRLVVAKGRCKGLNGEISVKPGAQFFAKIVDWITDGEKASPEEIKENSIKRIPKDDIMSKMKKIVETGDAGRAAAIELAGKNGINNGDWAALNKVPASVTHDIDAGLDSLIAEYCGKSEG